MSIPICAYVIAPTTVTDTVLQSCTVPEPAAGETLWNAETDYGVGDEAIRTTTHRKYKRLIAGTTAASPETDPADPPNWLDIGATNRWAQFDNKIGTQTSGATEVTTVLKPGNIGGLGLLELVGKTATVTMRSAPGGVIVYTKTANLDGSIITSIYDWMFGEYTQRKNVVFTDLPGQWTDCELTVTVSNPGGVAALGVLAIGRVRPLGATEYGAGAGIINWGKVQDDGFGNREYIEGNWSNRITLPIVTDRAAFSKLHQTLAALRSKPCIYVGSDLEIFESLICYGVFRDLYVTVPNYGMTSMNLEIEGLSN